MTYCISDIHGCYEEFMELLGRIAFNPETDVLYVLGDAMDRGDRPIDCLNYIRETKNVQYILGNHDEMMLEYLIDEEEYPDWKYNGMKNTYAQFQALSVSEQKEIVKFLYTRELYAKLTVNGKRFFLSHAGLNSAKKLSAQTRHDFVWSRGEFFLSAGLKGYIHVFGHTPTYAIRNSFDPSKNCAVWFDETHRDKVCIDCGCVNGGALAALRLEDGAVFYVNAQDKRNRRSVWCVENSLASVPIYTVGG
jgi:serine/threonine protein phosphatase 1